MKVALFLSLLALATPCMAAPPDLCELHGIKMERRALEVVYGMPAREEFKELEVAEKRFPHGRDYVLGGCVVRPEKKTEGYLCPACVKARADWLATRADKKR